jgi:hypothetical protein
MLPDSPGFDSVTNQNAVPHAAQRSSSLIIPPPALARPAGASASLAQAGQRRSRVSGKGSNDGIVWMGWVMIGLAAILVGWHARFTTASAPEAPIRDGRGAGRGNFLAVRLDRLVDFGPPCAHGCDGRRVTVHSVGLRAGIVLESRRIVVVR